MNPLMVGGFVVFAAYLWARHNPAASGSGNVRINNIGGNGAITLPAVTPNVAGSEPDQTPAAFTPYPFGLGSGASGQAPFMPMVLTSDGIMEPVPVESWGYPATDRASDLQSAARYMGNRAGSERGKKQHGGCGGSCCNTKPQCPNPCGDANTFSDGASIINKKGYGMFPVGEATITRFDPIATRYNPVDAYKNYGAYANSIIAAESAQITSGNMSEVDAFVLAVNQFKALNEAATYQSMVSQYPVKPKTNITLFDSPTSQSIYFTQDQLDTLHQSQYLINQPSMPSTLVDVKKWEALGYSESEAIHRAFTMPYDPISFSPTQPGKPDRGGIKLGARPARGGMRGFGPMAGSPYVSRPERSGMAGSPRAPQPHRLRSGLLRMLFA